MHKYLGKQNTSLYIEAATRVLSLIYVTIAKNDLKFFQAIVCYQFIKEREYNGKKYKDNPYLSLNLCYNGVVISE